MPLIKTKVDLRTANDRTKPAESPRVDPTSDRITEQKREIQSRAEA